MEESPKKSGWKIFLYLTPLYIVIAIPLVKWTLRSQSADIVLSKDEYNVFNSSDGEIKKSAPARYDPNLTDGAYTVNYRSAGTQQGTQEELDWGYQPGYLTTAVKNNLKNPQALEELFNNKWVVKGFMSRTTVKKTLSSKKALQNFLENAQEAKDFLSDPVIKSVISTPQALNALTESDMAKTLLAAPVVQELIKDPKAVESAVSGNPDIAALLRNSGVRTAIMASGQAAPLARSLGWK